MKKNKQSLVWRFYTEGDDKVHYLLGTMHVRDEKAFIYEADFHDKIRACDLFATEFDLDEADQAVVQSALMINEGQLLNNMLSPKFQEKADTFLTKYLGMPLTNFIYFKPIAIVNMLTEALFSKDRLLSLDESLWNFAKQEGKILRGIETFDEQVEVLRNMPIDEQVDALKAIIKNPQKFKRKLNKMTQYFEQADIQKLYKSAKKSTKGSSKILLYDRNILIANRIEKLTTEGSLCAAIGAGHFYGKQGVLRLLKQKGFKIKPVLS